MMTLDPVVAWSESSSMALLLSWWSFVSKLRFTKASPSSFPNSGLAMGLRETLLRVAAARNGVSTGSVPKRSLGTRANGGQEGGPGVGEGSDGRRSTGKPRGLGSDERGGSPGGSSCRVQRKWQRAQLRRVGPFQAGGPRFLGSRNFLPILRSQKSPSALGIMGRLFTGKVLGCKPWFRKDFLTVWGWENRRAKHASNLDQY